VGGITQHHCFVGCEEAPMLLTGWKQTLGDSSLAPEHVKDHLFSEAVDTL